MQSNFTMVYQGFRKDSLDSITLVRSKGMTPHYRVTRQVPKTLGSYDIAQFSSREAAFHWLGHKPTQPKSKKR